MDIDFTEQMVEKYKALLLANVGVKSVSINGQSVSYGDLHKEYEYWQKKLNMANGKKPTIFQFDLGGN